VPEVPGRELLEPVSLEGDGTAAGRAAGGEDRLYFRQLLSGRDFARTDPVARQMVNFAYVLGDRATGDAVVVDPAYAPGELIDAIEADGMRLTGVLVTHYHADHAGGSLFGHDIAGLQQLLEAAPVPVHVQKSEVPWVVRAAGVGEGDLVAHDPDDRVQVGGLEIRLIHTPGHTPGSQCFLADGRLVAGDTLFLEGCGRTDLPGSDPAAMYESLQLRLSRLPESTVVYPGHLYSAEPYADLAEVKRWNPVLAPRSPAEWLRLFGG
jgi:glyoxylase-like metal-dependent hydrolase (beta-lactamase superfamily II)